MIMSQFWIVRWKSFFFSLRFRFLKWDDAWIFILCFRPHLFVIWIEEKKVLKKVIQIGRFVRMFSYSHFFVPNEKCSPLRKCEFQFNESINCSVRSFILYLSKCNRGDQVKVEAELFAQMNNNLPKIEVEI